MNVGQLDQMETAARDVERVGQTIAGLLGKRPERLESFPVRWREASDRRVQYRCQHPDSYPQWVDVSRGVVECSECLMSSPLVDDGCCDVCETPTEHFREATLWGGPVTFHFNVCEACLQEVQADR